MGFPRQLGQHTGGFVITRGKLCDLVPVMNARMENRTCIEWNKDDIDALGFMKIDVLALGMLTCIRKAFDIAKEVYQHSMTPNSARGNVNGGDINFAQDENTFFFYKKSIKREYAKIIDDFLTMYGYKVNEVKIPNILGRKYFNFVKTVEANVESNVVPEKYLNEYKQMLNSGITFWHDPNHFLDYSVNNTIN
jgi:hypothetical protein